MASFYFLLIVSASIVAIVIKVFKKKCRLLQEDLKKLNLQNEEKNEQIIKLNAKAERFDAIANYDQIIASKISESQLLDKTLKELEGRIDPYRQSLELEESGFYKFQYNFEEVDKYADALQIIKDAQRVLINKKKAFHTSVMELENSPIINSIGKLGVRAFNSESYDVIERVSFNNFDSCKNRITAIYNDINKLMSPLNTYIDKECLELKLQELAIGYEYESEKQKIKQEQDEIRAQMREEELARREAEKARQDAIEEEKKYQLALQDARKEIEGKADEEKEKMLKIISDLESKLQDAQQKRERATAMAQITKAGNVYIISNIGSFGENILKIGMTRRREPMDRIRELSDASVPFQFDVHAMVYSEDAPKLENDLHNFFQNRRMNKINLRKEFFKVGIDDITEACTKLGYNIKLTKLAEARVCIPLKSATCSGANRPAVPDQIGRPAGAKRRWFFSSFS